MGVNVSGAGALQYGGDRNDLHVGCLMHGSKRLALIVGIGLCGSALGQPAPTGATGPSESTPGHATAGDPVTTADQLLDALQTADRDLVSLTADVKWDRTFEIQGDEQSRLGKLYYLATKPAEGGQPAERKFAIHFDQLWVAGVQRQEDRTYIFDGQWFMEKDAIGKYFQKRQVAPPGERIDPLQLGQGPIAIPIGQRKQDILDRFNVELLPAEAGLEAPNNAPKAEKDIADKRKGDVEGAWQLHLTPKARFAEEEDFTDIRLWYKRAPDGSILPRMARTVNKQGDVSSVLLINDQAQRSGRPENPKAHVPGDVIDTTPPQGWDGNTAEWRAHGAGDEAGH